MLTQKRLPKRLKRHKHVANTLHDAIENVGDRKPSTWPFFVERYLRFEVGIEVHLAWDGVVGAFQFEAREFCAVFQCAGRLRKDTMPDVHQIAEIQPLRANRGDGKVQDTVFITVIEVVEQIKGMEVRRPIRSVVRLQPLDDCLHARINAGDLTSAGIAPMRGSLPLCGLEWSQEVVISVAEDRELAPGGVFPAVLEDQLPNEVIQGRPGIVQAVADDQGQPDRRLTQHLRSHDVLMGLTVELNDQVARARWLQERNHLAPHRLEVFFRPLVLSDMTVE